MFGISGGRGRLVAIADIGSASAGVAILHVQENSPVEIISASRSILPLEERTEEATISGILANLALSAEKALSGLAQSEHAGERVTKTYAIIGSPWSQSETLESAERFDAEKRISPDVISRLAQLAVGQTTKLNLENVFETTVVRVKLNGYPTGHPIGRMAHEVRVFALMSDCNLKIRNAAEESLQHIFSSGRPLVRSGTRALLVALQELPNAAKDTLIIDVSTEGASMLILRDGLASEHAFIPEGARSILKRISAKGLPEETLSLLGMAEREECTTEACTAVYTALARIEPSLLQTFGDAMMKMAGSGRLPGDLVLITHPDLAPWLGKFFSRIDFAQFTFTAQPFSVRMLSSKDLAHLSVTGKSAVTDTGFSIAAALVNSES